MSFEKELQGLLNRTCQENGSDTPDFILAEFLNNNLGALNNAISQRDQWYGRETFKKGREGIDASLHLNKPNAQTQKILDFAVVFAICRKQTIEDIRPKFDQWLTDNPGVLDLSRKEYQDSILHHCFPVPPISDNPAFRAMEYLSALCGQNQVWWINSAEGLQSEAFHKPHCNMFLNIKRLSGVAFFIGEMGYVKEEYAIAKEIGVDCILIP